MTQMIHQYKCQQRGYASQVRKFINKKYITKADIEQLIKLISTNHISFLKHLNTFFINFRNQLILSSLQYRQKFGATPLYELTESDLVSLSKYFNKGQPINRFIFYTLYRALRRKINLYIQQGAKSPYFQSSQQLQNFQNNIQSKKEIKFEQKVISHIFPEAFQLQKTIKQELDFTKRYFPKQNNQKKTEIHPYDPSLSDIQQLPKEGESIEDRVALRMVSKIFGDDIVINQSQDKNTIYQKQPIHFDLNKFHDIKQYIQKQKVFYQAATSNSQFYNNKKSLRQLQKLQTISSQCINCVPFAYNIINFSRQRCSIVNYATMKSVKDVKKNQKRFTELIQGFVNSPNGGTILFNCEDMFSNVKPIGFQGQLKDVQARKQSLIDLIRNNFPLVKIDQDYILDFVKVRTTISNSAKFKLIASNKQQNQKQLRKDLFIIRMKIMGSKTSSLDVRKQDQISQVPSCFIHTDHYNKKLSKQEIYNQRQKRFLMQQCNYKDPIKGVSNRTKAENDSVIFGRMFQMLANKNKILQVFQGRRSYYKKHQTICKSPYIQWGNSKKMVQNTKQSYQPTSLNVKISQRANVHSRNKNYQYWMLLVVDVSQMANIQKKLEEFFPISLFSVQSPFKGMFAKSKSTVLIKSSFRHSQIANKIANIETQQNKHFQLILQKQKKSLPVFYIKVYSYIEIEFYQNSNQAELADLKVGLEELLEDYPKVNKLWRDSCKVRVFRQQSDKTVYLTSQQTSPSYSLIFLYYYFKDRIYDGKVGQIRRRIKSVKFKEQNKLNQQIKSVYQINTKR